MWVAVAAELASSGPLGRYSRFTKGNDFVQFYVAGVLVRTGQFDVLVDDRGFRHAQAPYLPTDSVASFPPVYGPQVGLAFAPLTVLPYLTAYAVWCALTVLLIGVSVRVFWRHCPHLRSWPGPVAALTAAFPPMGYLILDGQISAVAVGAIAVLVAALRRESRRLAGVAVGLLGYKLSLFVPALAVCVLSGEWAISGVALTVAVVQVFAVAPIMGLDVVHGFFENTASLVRSPDSVVMRPYLTGSWRTFWAALFPGFAARCAYGVSAAATVAAAAWGWRRTEDPLCRAALLSLAVALASPHFFLYDLVIVAPAFLASAALLVDRRLPALRVCAYLAFVVPLSAPLAAVTRIQPVTLVLAAWLTFLITAVGHTICLPRGLR
jgi:glycosyl transferase family 87